MLLEEFSGKYKQLLDAELRRLIDILEAPSVIKESMYYSLSAGGKRIRPLLLFATMDAFGADPEKGLPAAAAVEMVHTYSLIHDDLPSMDNDHLRRGKPTNHVVFGDAIATLAGDALLTYSFEVLGNSPDSYVDSATKVRLMVELARAAGTEGMVGGQVADMNGEGQTLTIEELEYIHTHKTGKILSFCVKAGAILAGANQKEYNDLSTFAHHLGLAFQIRDDILDIEGNEEMIGKPVGSDTSNEKSTYPSLLTMEGAKKALTDHILTAKKYLESTNLKTTMLNEITELVASRDH